MITRVTICLLLLLTMFSGCKSSPCLSKAEIAEHCLPVSAADRILKTFPDAAGFSSISDVFFRTHLDSGDVSLLGIEAGLVQSEGGILRISLVLERRTYAPDWSAAQVFEILPHGTNQPSSLYDLMNLELGQMHNHLVEHAEFVRRVRNGDIRLD